MTEDNQTFRLQLLGHQLRQAQELVDGLHDAGKQLAEMKKERDKLQSDVARLRKICDEAFVHLPLTGEEHMCYADHDIVPHVQQVAAAWGERAEQEKTIAKLKEECALYKERLEQKGWQKVIEQQNRIKELQLDNERLRRDRYDALSVYSKDGLLSSEWIARTGKAERERDEALKKAEESYVRGRRDQSAEEAGLYAAIVERVATLEERDQQLQLRAVTVVERLEEFRKQYGQQLAGSTQSFDDKMKSVSIVNRCLEIVRGVLRGDAEENPNE